MSFAWRAGNNEYLQGARASESNCLDGGPPLGREAIRLHVRGVDMLDGTPILDIKPYLSHPPESELKRGWLAEADL